jgi:hypothetical protein
VVGRHRAHRLDDERDPEPGSHQGEQAGSVRRLLDHTGHEAGVEARADAQLTDLRAAVGGQGHEVVVGELAQGEAGPAGESVRALERDGESVVLHHARAQPAPASGHGEGEVEGAVRHPGRRLGRVERSLQHQLDAGQLGGDRADQQGQAHAGAGAGEADRDPSHLAAAGGGGGAAGDRSRGEHVARRLQQ